MPTTSKSKGQKSKVKQQKRNWFELPYDVKANIIQRIGVFDMLQNAQIVCTSWHKMCNDPFMWRVIDFSEPKCWDPVLLHRRPLQDMCKHAVDRSQGELVDISIMGFADNELLQYVADRSSQLRRLEISFCYEDLYESWTEALKKFPLLEELSIYSTDISIEAIETAASCCLKLKTLKLNENPLRRREFIGLPNERAIAIGENFPELKHLELIGDRMSNAGLEVILDGCRHLELLDLRACLYIDLEGVVGKKCLERIKCVKLPKDSLEGCPYRESLYSYNECIRCFSGVWGDDYDDDDLPNTEELKEMLSSMWNFESVTMNDRML